MKITKIFSDEKGESHFEDISGKGHKTKNLEKRERTSLFIHI